MKQCVVFDLDGTLADITHRVHFVDGSPVAFKIVEQDPNDEPAAVLLERIKAEKIRHVAVAKVAKQKFRVKS